MSTTAHMADTTNNNSNPADDGPLKKRTAERQLRSDEDPDDDVQQEADGTWKKADENVMAQRRIVKVRGRSAPTTSATPSPAFSFSATPAATTPAAETPKAEEKKEEPKTESKDEKAVATNTDTKPAATAPIFGANVSSPFSFSTAPFSFTPAATTTTPAPFSFATAPAAGGFSFATNPTSIFNFNAPKPAAANGEEPEEGGDEDVQKEVVIEAKRDLPPPPPQKTGEEDETQLFQTRGKLFLLDAAANQWRERGVGQIRVNENKQDKSLRMLMRVEGTHRLILNTSLAATRNVEKPSDKAVRFIAIDYEKGTPASFLVRVGHPSAASDLFAAIEQNAKKAQSRKGESSTSTTNTNNTTTTSSSSADSKATTTETANKETAATESTPKEGSS